ncbi:hypothetical protein ACA910_010672 [Epithemia clementina (nom. ined.)]
MTTGTVLSVAASSTTKKQYGAGGNKEATKIKAKILDLTTDSPAVVATVQNKKTMNKKQEATSTQHRKKEGWHHAKLH